ncbi:MAG: hypothetical protein KGO22_00865, partial [Gammaproteobacteria bacterium]|nr:hypothetical protein [Gammaproteobacteria bacterium]
MSLGSGRQSSRTAITAGTVRRRVATRGSIAVVYIVHTEVYYVRMTRDRIFAAAKTVLDREGL